MSTATEGSLSLAYVFDLQDAANALADAVDAFMEAGEANGVRIQTQFPVGESFVWRLKEKVKEARTLASKEIA